MSFSRRSFLKWAASISTLAVGTPSYAKLLSLSKDRKGCPTGSVDTAQGFQPSLLPSQKEVWSNLTWMAKLGPKYTGNKAHTTYVDFLATEMKKLGLTVTRDTYTLPMWEAKRWEINVAPATGKAFKAPVTSYFPYSGQTLQNGVTGELAYAGSNPSFKLDNLQEKIALIDFACDTRKYGDEYANWGVYPSGAAFPSEVRPARGAVGDLTKFQKAGALGVILAWTDISDANAADQYTPFSRPPQGIPGLYVGRDTGAKLKALASSGARVTIVLEATITPDTPTDTVIATLPGSTADEIIMVNTHTDGPNATEENGAIASIALAKYFAAIPTSKRRRTIVFPMTTGHFALPWVPSMEGVIKKYPDMIKKCVAALTIEHLGCREWLDDASMQYRYTGENQWSVAITEYNKMGGILLEALQGSADRKTGVVNPVHGGWIGEGGWPNRAGIPTIGYIPQPNYLLADRENGCIDKLSPELLHSQIEVFAKCIHMIDVTRADELRAKRA
jgi:hypothetical protein